MRKPQPTSVLLLGPAPPPYGGMALQGRLLQTLLRGDGTTAHFAPSNPPLSGRVAFLGRIKGLRTLVRAVLLWKTLWREIPRAGVVHVLAASWLYFFVVVYPAVVIGRYRRKRVIVNYRGGEARQFFERFGLLCGPVFKTADAITAPSQFLASVIGDRFGVAVSIVPNIVDAAAFRFRRRAVLEPKLLISRHLEEIYDIPTALRAFQAIQKHYPEASLWIAGGGPEEQSLRAQAVALDLRQVRFLGPVTHGDLPAIYEQCDIMLNSSRVDNFPNALIEASAAGLVIVSTAPGGIPFIYENGNTAILVEPGDWSGLAEGVMRLLENPPLAAAMANRAARVAAACDWSQVRAALYQSYGMTPPQRQAETVMVTQ